MAKPRISEKTAIMAVETVSVESLHLDPANVRKHDERNIDSIRASLTRFGQQHPIIVNPEGVVVAGNGRLQAMRSMGWKECRVVRTDLKGPEAVAFAIADNRTAELAEWDDDALAKTLAALQNDESIDHLAAGFTDDEIAKLVDEVMGSAEVVEDEVPEPPADPITKPGDLWLLGEHRLLCGDSTKAEDVEQVLNGALADTVTDPPYGIGYEYDGHDDKSPEDNAKLVDSVLSLAPGAHIYTPGLMNLFRELKRYPRARVLVWHKGFAQAGNGLGGASTWEPIVVHGVKGGRLPNDYLHFGTDREPGLRDKHSCPKPVKLFAHMIEHLTGKTIYEPFCGSGTTLIAAEQLGRKCYGIEISPAYCDVIVERWENLTGKKAERDAQ